MPAVTLIRDSEGAVASAVVVGVEPDRDREALERLAEAIRQGEAVLAFDDGWTVTVA